MACLPFKTGYNAISAGKVGVPPRSLPLQADGLMYPGCSDAAFLPRILPWQQLTFSTFTTWSRRSKGSIEPRQEFGGGNISLPSPSS